LLRRIELAKAGEHVLRRAVLCSLGSQLYGFNRVNVSATVTSQQFDFSSQNPVPEMANAPNAVAVRSTPTAVKQFNIESEFRELTKKWKSERGATSFSTKICTHPAYQRIIGLGLPVVPLILAELQRELDHWFWALTAITGEDPVLPESRGRVTDMANQWLKWGREHGYIR